MMGNGIMSVAQRMQRLGRDGDTILAHINPQEAMQLMRMGGRGTTNPMTGLPEFAPEVDPLFYLSVNPQVMLEAQKATRAQGIQPGEDFTAAMNEYAQAHYEQFGHAEGRAPNKDTAVESTAATIQRFEEDPQAFADFYAERNPNVAAAVGTNPQDLLGHYLQFGVGETDFSGSPDVGRLTDPSQIVAPPETFDPIFYGQRNPDVVAVYGPNPDRLYRHFLDYGQAEVRLGSADAGSGTDDTVITPTPVSTIPGPSQGIPAVVDLPATATTGESFSPRVAGDTFTPADISGIATITPENIPDILADQGVGVRFYILEADDQGNMVKRYVPANTPGAIREVTGVYGTVGGEFDFYPNEIGTIPAELDVAGRLGIGD